MIALIRKRSLQTEAAITIAEIAEIKTATLRSEHSEKKARAGLEGRKKLIKEKQALTRKIGDWKFLQEMEMAERGKGEAVDAQAKAKADGVTSTRRGTGRTVSTLETAPKAKVCSAQTFTTF